MYTAVITKFAPEMNVIRVNVSNMKGMSVMDLILLCGYVWASKSQGELTFMYITDAWCSPMDQSPQGTI